MKTFNLKNITQIPVRALASQSMAFALSSAIAMLPLAPAQVMEPVQSSAMQGQVSISREINMTAKPQLVSINLRDAELRDVLNILAKQGNFNIILDKSVTGTLTVDIKNVAINKALEYIFTVAQLTYSKDGNTLIVASKTDGDQKSLSAKTLKTIPVLYRDAMLIAKTLNQTVLKVSRPGGSSVATVMADPSSNSILVIGTERDIALVTETMLQMDTPRHRKVYAIRHSRPDYVATVLAANFFQFQDPTMVTGGGTSGGAGGAPAGGASLGGNVGGGGMGGGMGGAAGGAGAAGAAGGAAGGAGGAGAAGGTGGGAGGAGQMPVLSTFTQGGVTFIAEPVAATLTVLATEAQIALIDSIIDQVDVKRPQVQIEVSLVEIQNSDLKSFRPLWGRLNIGKDSNAVLNRLDAGGNPTGENVFSFIRNNTTNPISGLNPLTTLTIRQTNQNIKGKVLANPTIVAMDGQSSQIEITDQVPNITQSAAVGNAGAAVLTTAITTQDAGITLQLTPTITNDGSVVLNLQPDVSQPTRIVTAGAVSSTLISKRTLNLNAVRVKDGQTLVIGGLLRETNQMDINRIPGLDKLPIVSAMFRAINSNNRDKTELVLMVTPHILREDAVTYFNSMANGVPMGNGVSAASQGSSYTGTNRTVGSTPILRPGSSTQINPAGATTATPTEAIPLRP